MNDEEKKTNNSTRDLVPWSEVTHHFARGRQYLNLANEYLGKAEKSRNGQRIIAHASRKGGGSTQVEWDINHENLVIISIIFCALAAEAIINEYATLNLPREYYNNYLSKLSLLSKWVVIPRIVTGKGILPTCSAIKDLDRLIKLRNHLVHDKPVKRQVTELNLKFPPDIVGFAFAKHGVHTVLALINELKSLDNHKLPMFE